MAAGRLLIEVAYALPDRCWRVPLDLPDGATVGDALDAAAMPERVPGAVVSAAMLAVFGRSVDRATPLHDGDRVEILRPLQADPKQARRARARGAAKP